MSVPMVVVMDFFVRRTVVIGGISLNFLGMLVIMVAGTCVAPLFGMYESGPWWFTPSGGLTQGAIVAYLVWWSRSPHSSGAPHAAALLSGWDRMGCVAGSPHASPAGEPRPRL